MPDTTRAVHDPGWLWPGLMVLALLAVLCAVVAPSIAWLAIPLIGETGWLMHGHGYRATSSWTLPLLVVLVVLTSFTAAPWVPVAAALGGAALTIVMLFSRSAQLRWLALLPARWLGQPWLVRIEMAAFTRAVVRCNRIFDAINATGATDRARSEVRALQAVSGHERERAMVWRAAWDGLVAQLDTTAEMLESDDPGAFADVLAERRAAVLAGERAAAAETRRLDPFGVSISQPGMGLIEDRHGRAGGRAPRGGPGGQ